MVEWKIFKKFLVFGIESEFYNLEFVCVVVGVGCGFFVICVFCVV